MSKVITTKILPEDITLLSPGKNLDYLCCQYRKIPTRITALEAYKIMTSKQPKWLGYAFYMRDVVTGIFGVKEIQGFTQLENEFPKIGEKVHFFTVLENEANKLTLIVEDHHLDICLCLKVEHHVEDHDDENRLYVVASVKNKNWVGKSYMIPVGIAHPQVVRSLLNNFKTYSQ